MTLETLVEDQEGGTVDATFALPVHGSSAIWLPLTSLCRQDDLGFNWELILYEDPSELFLGPEIFREWAERMNCRRAYYIGSDEFIPLSMKWRTIADVADSFAFILTAHDDYYSPKRLKASVEELWEADFCYVPEGYFWSFHHSRLIYSKARAPGLSKALRTEHMKEMPWEKWNITVDSWIHDHLPEGSRVTMIDPEKIWTDQGFEIHTDGRNKISLNRSKHFIDPTPPFYPTETRLEELIPLDIATKIRRSSDRRPTIYADD